MKKIQDYISKWEKRCYTDGIPEDVPKRIEQLNLAPSYKALVKCILKNDSNLKSLGVTVKKPKEYHELKRIELNQRYKSKEKQLKLI